MVTDVILEAGHWSPHKWRRLRSHMNAGLEVIHVAAGRSVWHIDGRPERVAPGSVFFTLPWQEHGGVAEREPGIALSFVVLALDRVYRRPVRRFGFHPALGVTGREAQRIAHLLRDSTRHAHPASPALAWLVPRLVDEHHQSTQLGTRALAAALGRAVVIELARCIEAAPSSVAPAAHASDAERRVATFLETLRRRCTEQWTLERMAESCGLGRTRFAQLVKQQTGDSPIMVLNRQRIERAQQMLRGTNASVTEVAFACGFSSAQYFARVFQEYTGRTATMDRQQGASPPAQRLSS
ncbi:MAG: AraC family transcriptional regulator [Phycisphaeraceae bacterium]